MLFSLHSFWYSIWFHIKEAISLRGTLGIVEHSRLEKLQAFLGPDETVISSGTVGEEAYIISNFRILIYTKDGWMLEFYPEEIYLRPWTIGGHKYLHLDYLNSYDYFFEDLGMKAEELVRIFQKVFN